MTTSRHRRSRPVHLRLARRDIGNILAFERDFPGAPVVRLEENFRSSPQVLKLADELIQANAQRKAKRLIARRPDGARPRLYRYSDEGEEARGAAAWVRAMHEENGLEYRRIAVFYRTNAMSRAVEEALVQAAIPYQIVKGVEFFHRREIKDVLAYLRLLINPADEVSLLRVINRPARGLGDTTVQKITAQARSVGKDIGSVLLDAATVPGLTSSAAARIGVFAALLGEMRRKLDRPVAEIVRDVYVRSGLKTLSSTKRTWMRRERGRARPFGPAIRRGRGSFGIERVVRLSPADGPHQRRRFLRRDLGRGLAHDPPQRQGAGVRRGADHRPRGRHHSPYPQP